MRTNVCLFVAATAAITATSCGGGPRAAGGPNAGGPPRAPSTPANATARAEIRDTEGRSVGTLTLTQTPHGLLVQGDLSNLQPGTRAIHLHEVGRCDSPFTSAGGHYNPTQRVHGFKSAGGHHAGDLPNFAVGANGTGRVDLIATAVTLGSGPGSLFDVDGTSVVIHSGPDDYATDPAGGAGTRIACGVVAR
jgi:Cu-Zn family superoxide dismutase